MFEHSPKILASDEKAGTKHAVAMGEDRLGLPQSGTVGQNMQLLWEKTDLDFLNQEQWNKTCSYYGRRQTWTSSIRNSGTKHAVASREDRLGLPYQAQWAKTCSCYGRRQAWTSTIRNSGTKHAVVMGEDRLGLPYQAQWAKTCSCYGRR